MESAVFFNVDGEGAAAAEDTAPENPALVQVAWWISDWQTEHPVALGIVTTLVVALVTLWIRERPRLDRLGVSLRLTAEAPRKPAPRA
jgi:hypothetical protein